MEKLELGLPEDYKPSDGEINNIVYLTCKYTCEWPMRAVDLKVCSLMVGEIKGDAGITKLVETTCEYLWDHICGEPDEVSPQTFEEHMRPILTEWYKIMTPEERASID